MRVDRSSGESTHNWYAQLTLPDTAETAPSRRAAVISFIAVGLGWSLFWFCVRESGFDLACLSLNNELVEVLQRLQIIVR